MDKALIWAIPEKNIKNDKFKIKKKLNAPVPNPRFFKQGDGGISKTEGDWGVADPDLGTSLDRIRRIWRPWIGVWNSFDIFLNFENKFDSSLLTNPRSHLK